MYLPDPPAEIRLDLAIILADREVMQNPSDETMSRIVESMLPHKQILRDRLGDMDTQARMETYGH